jgi:hypothetical protein
MIAPRELRKRLSRGFGQAPEYEKGIILKKYIG